MELSRCSQCPIEWESYLICDPKLSMPVRRRFAGQRWRAILRLRSGQAPSADTGGYTAGQGLWTLPFPLPTWPEAPESDKRTRPWTHENDGMKRDLLRQSPFPSTLTNYAVACLRLAGQLGRRQLEGVAAPRDVREIAAQACPEQSRRVQPVKLIAGELPAAADAARGSRLQRALAIR